MTIRLLLFAHYRDLAGASELDVRLPAGATAADLIRQVRSDIPRFRDLPAEPAIAVNRAYSSLSAKLAEGDEVALLPPVSGG